MRQNTTDKIQLLRNEIGEFKNSFWREKATSFDDISEQLQIIKTDIRDISTKLSQILHPQKVVS